jgi:hypothetical protein
MAHLRTTQAIGKANEIMTGCHSLFDVCDFTSLGASFSQLSGLDISNTTRLAHQALPVATQDGSSYMFSRSTKPILVYQQA